MAAVDLESQPAQAAEEDEVKVHRELGLEDLCSNAFTQALTSLDQDAKPYFVHLTTRAFFKRLVRSLVPASKYEDILSQPDFYGPLLLTFILSSILHFNLKSITPASLESASTVGDGYLATSLLFCFASLSSASLALDVAWQYGATALSHETRFGLDRAVCVAGYSFFGPCIILLLWPRAPWLLAMPLCFCLELGTSLSAGAAAFSASQKKSTLLPAAVACVHALWLIALLRFSQV